MLEFWNSEAFTEGACNAGLFYGVVELDETTGDYVPVAAFMHPDGAMDYRDHEARLGRTCHVIDLVGGMAIARGNGSTSI